MVRLRWGFNAIQRPDELDAIIRDSSAVQVRIGPEGTLVLDTASSSVSRTQLQEQTGANLERVQVSTRPYTNCFARLRRAPSKRWSNQETELFYKVSLLSSRLVVSSQTP